MVTPGMQHAPATRERGFTLIELMVVVAVIGLLVGVAMPTYRNAITRARESVLKENLFILRQTIDRYYADKGYYPQTLDVLVDEGYLRQIPVDPFLGRNEWEEIQADPDTSLDPSQPPGVWDVRSLAEGSARDGTPYADL
ncbi:MAG: prepilin-type N-terminal cleavage/methylation domain-containing protein [Acidobacteriota bacterium]